MTPAINLLKKLKISHNVHEYGHDPAAESYGIEAVEKLGVEQALVFKTLVVKLDQKELVVCVIPVCDMLSLKQIAKAAKAKKAVMGEQKEVERTTGYILGGVSPLGQKRRLRTFIDSTAECFETIYISGGRRGLDIELSPADIAKVVNAQFCSLTQN